MAGLPFKSLPLGYRFRPTDEELISHYLRKKINCKHSEVDVIPEVDICKYEPWDLPDKSEIRSVDQWFFFTPCEKKYPNGHRSNRATQKGYWKATGKDRTIKSRSNLIGMKKTLVFYRGRAPKGERSNWIMHEYRATEEDLDGTKPGQSPYVLCRLFKKPDENTVNPSNDDMDEKNDCPNYDEVDPSGLSPVTGSSSLEDTQRAEDVVENTPLLNQHVPEFYMQDEPNPLYIVVKTQPGNTERCLPGREDNGTSYPLLPEENHCDSYVEDHEADVAAKEVNSWCEALGMFDDPTFGPIDNNCFSLMTSELKYNGMNPLPYVNFEEGQPLSEFRDGSLFQDESPIPTNEIFNEDRDEHAFSEINSWEDFILKSDTLQSGKQPPYQGDSHTSTMNSAHPSEFPLGNYSRSSSSSVMHGLVRPESEALRLVAQSGSSFNKHSTGYYNRKHSTGYNSMPVAKSGSSLNNLSSGYDSMFMSSNANASEVGASQGRVRPDLEALSMVGQNSSFNKSTSGYNSSLEGQSGLSLNESSSGYDSKSSSSNFLVAQGPVGPKLEASSNRNVHGRRVVQHGLGGPKLEASNNRNVLDDQVVHQGLDSYSKLAETTGQQLQMHVPQCLPWFNKSEDSSSKLAETTGQNNFACEELQVDFGATGIKIMVCEPHCTSTGLISQGIAPRRIRFQSGREPVSLKGINCTSDSGSSDVKSADRDSCEGSETSSDANHNEFKSTKAEDEENMEVTSITGSNASELVDNLVDLSAHSNAFHKKIGKDRKPVSSVTMLYSNDFENDVYFQSKISIESNEESIPTLRLRGGRGNDPVGGGHEPEESLQPALTSKVKGGFSYAYCLKITGLIISSSMLLVGLWKGFTS